MPSDFFSRRSDHAGLPPCEVVWPNLSVEGNLGPVASRVDGQPYSDLAAVLAGEGGRAHDRGVTGWEVVRHFERTRRPRAH